MINKKKPSKLSIIFAGIYFVFTLILAFVSIIVICFWCVKFSLEVLDSETPIQKLEALVDKMPEGTLKSNLCTVIASEYANDGDELNDILRVYSELKIQQLQNGESF